MTAEEFFNNWVGEDPDKININIKDVTIEFAKYHVEKCKAEMKLNFSNIIGGREGFGNEIIDSVYPIENIK